MKLVKLLSQPAVIFIVFILITVGIGVYYYSQSEDFKYFIYKNPPLTFYVEVDGDSQNLKEMFYSPFRMLDVRRVGGSEVISKITYNLYAKATSDTESGNLLLDTSGLVFKVKIQGKSSSSTAYQDIPSLYKEQSLSGRYTLTINGDKVKVFTYDYSPSELDNYARTNNVKYFWLYFNVDGSVVFTYNGETKSQKPGVSELGIELEYYTPGVNQPPSISSFDVVKTDSNKVKATFSASDPDNSTLSYEIQWGDGSYDKGTMSSGSTTTLYHTYSSYGTYNIDLSISDSTTKIVNRKSITLSSSGGGGGSGSSNSAPTIQYFETVPVTCYKFNFKFKFSNDDSYIMYYKIDFGDGSSVDWTQCSKDKEYIITYTYSTTLTTTATLYVKDYEGKTASKSITVKTGFSGTYPKISIRGIKEVT